MVHEFLSVRDGRIDKPHIQHEEEEDKEECNPVPFTFQFIDPVGTMEQVPCDKSKEWHECCLNGNSGQATIPGQDSKREN